MQVMLADAHAPAVLAYAPAAVMLADARAPAVLQVARVPLAVMLADVRAPAVLAQAPLSVMLVPPQSLHTLLSRLCWQMRGTRCAAGRACGRRVDLAGARGWGGAAERQCASRSRGGRGCRCSGRSVGRACGAPTRRTRGRRRRRRTRGRVRGQRRRRPAAGWGSAQRTRTCLVSLELTNG